MRIAVIDGALVENVIEADADFAIDDRLLVPDPDGLAEPGGTWADGVFAPAPDPETAPAPLTPETYGEAIQALLDARAAERQYDSIQTAVTYRDDPNAVFAAEAAALFAWRSEVWTYALAQFAAVAAGERAPPTIAEILAELPAFIWPELD